MRREYQSKGAIVAAVILAFVLAVLITVAGVPVDEAERVSSANGYTAYADVEGNLDVTGTLTADIGRTTTFSVAANDSSSLAKAQADYVCDSTADDVEINAAIDALPSGGGKLLLLEGTYYLSSTIGIPSLVTVEGCGWGTVLRISYDANIDAIENQNPDTYTDCKIRLANFQIDCNKSEQTTKGRGIDFSKVTEITIENILIIDSRGIALNLYGCRWGLVQGVEITGSRYGIYINGIDTEKAAHLEISGNIIRDCGIDGSGVEGAIHLADYCENIRIIGNRLYDNYGQGIYCEKVNNKHIDIKNNTCEGQGWDGILALLGTAMSVIDNNTYNNGGDGIAIDGLQASVINSNVCHGNEGRGILITDATSGITPSDLIVWDNNVFNNDQSGNGYAGIELQNATYIVLTENRCHDIRATGTYDYLTIADNQTY